MLSIGRLGTTGGAEYYLDKVANNVDDYYLGRGEAPGQWIGATSEQLGLVGQVEADMLRNLLAGRSASGEDLGVQLRPERRPGYDLTFSAPKGVSLLWAFGTGDVRDAISVAHDRAVGAVLDHLSTEACYARRGRDGQATRRSRRVHRRRVPSPHQPGRRSPAPHPRRRPQPGPGCRRPVVRP